MLVVVEMEDWNDDCSGVDCVSLNTGKQVFPTFALNTRKQKLNTEKQKLDPENQSFEHYNDPSREVNLEIIFELNVWNWC